MRLVSAVAASVAMSVLVACNKGEAELAPPPAPAASTSTSSGAPGTQAGHGALRLVKAAPIGDAASTIRTARDKAKAEGRDLVVYVGATWCEPCQYFHKAAAAGELDAAFPELTVLEFDLDEDRARLTAAGYVGELIPLFALPDDSGRASGRKFEGSIKGPGAVANITPKLKTLLGK